MEDEKIINENEQTKPEGTTEGIESQNIEIKVGSEPSVWEKFRARKQLYQRVRSVFIAVCSALVILFLIFFVLYIVPALAEISPSQRNTISNNNVAKKDAAYKKQVSLLSRDIQRMSLKYNAYTSGQSYIVVNTTENRFYLYTNKKLIREGFCSSGSYTMLQTSGNKKWVFKTPKGKYWIHGKTTNPVWKRPDWSFVEEGSPIPPKDDFSRYEYGVLGDYALAIGDGYLIHGTIYKRFLGMPVTHGCVRLNDEDLKVIFNTLNIGSKVYIF